MGRGGVRLRLFPFDVRPLRPLLTSRHSISNIAPSSKSEFK
jgi:hypothetical protein